MVGKAPDKEFMEKEPGMDIPGANIGTCGVSRRRGESLAELAGRQTEEPAGWEAK